MAEREIIIEQKGDPKVLLKDSEANKFFTEEGAPESTMDEDIELKK
ncbi:hypothetical protein [Colwellia hornerae]|nr:hypothetical protein [Colwellia hornerae]